jgi:hypothetical protein
VFRQPGLFLAKMHKYCKRILHLLFGSGINCIVEQFDVDFFEKFTDVAEVIEKNFNNPNRHHAAAG